MSTPPVYEVFYLLIYDIGILFFSIFHIWKLSLEDESSAQGHLFYEKAELGVKTDAKPLWSATTYKIAQTAYASHPFSCSQLAVSFYCTVLEI